MPTLSIIIPVFNKEQYIDSSIESILNQTFADFEIILVNDGSTDASGERCNYFAQLDPRVRVVHQKNQGVSSARNHGLQIAKGKYIGFVDCDDTLEPDMYETLVGNALRHQADVSICGVQKVFADKTEVYFGTKKTRIYNNVEATAGLLKKEFLRSVYDKVYESGLAKSVLFKGQIYEDILYNFTVLSKARKTVFEDVVKYNYLIRENSVSMSKFNAKYMDTITVSKQMVDVCKRQMPALLDEAVNFDFIAHISLLNIILISEKNKFLNEYKEVAGSLSTYPWYASRKAINWKHKSAYYMFKFSPALYEHMMKLYCDLTQADVSKKK
jgi:glycosyltransferase involved in cell wall biosynthesis